MDACIWELLLIAIFAPSRQTSCELFNLLLNSDGPVDLELPSQWLWDLLDEFIWQFQSFGQYRSDWKTKAEEEMTLLAEGNQVWSCYSVLNVLYSLIQKSRINEQLEAEQVGKSAEEIACVLAQSWGYVDCDRPLTAPLHSQ